MPKSVTDIIRKENYKQIFLMNMDTNSSTNTGKLNLAIH
jgi:hypothetical protein